MALSGNRRNRQGSLRTGLLVILTLGLSVSLCAQGASSRPNIVFILADDLGYGDLSSYGATRIQTPNIDRLADQGVLFTDAHSPSSVCTPTRYGLLTGRYCWRTWLTRSALSSDAPLLIEGDRPTVASLLQSAGYYTACIGKWHLGFGREDDYAKHREGQGEPNSWRSRKGGPNWNGELKPGPLEVGFDYYYGIPIVNSYPPYVFIEGHRVVGHRCGLGIACNWTIQLARWSLRTSAICKVEGRRDGKITNWRMRPRTRAGPAWPCPPAKLAAGPVVRSRHRLLALELTAKMVAQLENLAGRQPFFLYYSPHQPHRPYRPNGRFEPGPARGPCGTTCPGLFAAGWLVSAVPSSFNNGTEIARKCQQMIVVNSYSICLIFAFSALWVVTYVIPFL